MREGLKGFFVYISFGVDLVVIGGGWIWGWGVGIGWFFGIELWVGILFMVCCFLGNWMRCKL